MKLIIEKIENGFLVTTKDDVTEKKAFTYEDDKDEPYVFANLCYHAQSYFLQSNRYAEETVRHLIVPGDKYDGELTERTKETKEYLKHLFENG